MKNETTPPAFPELAAMQDAYNAALAALENLESRRYRAERTLEESREELAVMERTRTAILKRQALQGTTPETAAALAKAEADITAARAEVKTAQEFLAVFPAAQIDALRDLETVTGELANAARQVAVRELEAARIRLLEAIRGPLAEVLGWQDILSNTSPGPMETLANLKNVVNITVKRPPFTVPELSLQHKDILRKAGYR